MKARDIIALFVFIVVGGLIGFVGGYGDLGTIQEAAKQAAKGMTTGLIIFAVLYFIANS